MTLRFQRRLMRIKKGEFNIEKANKYVKVYLKQNEGELEQDTDLLEKWYSICNEYMFGETEALNTLLESDPSLKQFYETNREQLSKVNNNFRVLELNSMYLSLPMNFKKLFRFPVQDKNCFLGDQVSDEIIEVPAKNISDFLDHLVEAEKEFIATNKTPQSKFVTWIAEKITNCKHKHQIYGTRNFASINYIESLFLIYGPELFHKSKVFFEKNADKMDSKEYTNVYYFFMTASLRASAYYTEDQFDAIFEWNLSMIRPMLTETKETLIESISAYLLCSLDKQTYARYEKMWRHLIRVKSELAENNRYLLFPLMMALLNNTQGMRPQFVKKELDELFETKIEKIKHANFVNLAARQLVKFVYKPTNIPKKLPQLSLKSNLSDAFILKECLSGAQKYYENLI